jgi:hypothetical protein
MNKVAAIFCLLLILILGLDLHADNPLLRACRQTQAEAVVFNFGEANDQFMFCKYSEFSMVDAKTVMDKIYDNQNSIALDVYHANVDNDQNTCISNEGRILKGINYEGESFLFCIFEDSSLMELSTITRGINDPKNERLNQALFGQ